MDIEKVVTNRNILSVDGIPINCRVDSINEEGEVVLEGEMPETQRLLAIGTEFEIHSHPDGDLLVRGKVIRVLYQDVLDVTCHRPDDAMVSTLSLQLLCDIPYCRFFEPVFIQKGAVDE